MSDRLPRAGRGQRPLRARRGRAAADARRLPARGSRPDGDPPGLRARLLRQLQRAARRRDRALVPDVRRPGRRALARRRSRGSPRPDGTLGALQQAFHDHHGLQCGFCTPAMLLTAQEYLRRASGRRHRRARSARRSAASLCRCTGLPAHRRVDPRGGADGARMSIAEQDPNAAKVARETAAPDGRAAGSARASTASRTRASSAARAATSTTSSSPGMAHAAIVRSPHAHARIVSHRHLERPRRCRAWSRVVTGKDVAEHAAPLPSFGAGPIVQDMIAIEKVRHYGETVAAVIAENRYIAEDACDLIEVEYEPLPVVLDPVEAREDGAPLVHEALGTNTAYERTFSFGEVDRAFADAPRSVDAPSCTGRARPGCRWTPTARSATTTRARASSTIYANSMNFTYFLWLIAGVAEDPGEQAQARAGGGRRQLRLEVLHAQGADLRGVPVDARRPAGEVRRGPGHPHRQQRPLRLGSPVRGGAGVRRRRHVAGAPDRLRRRLRRLPPVRHRHPRQRACPRSSGPTGSSTSSTRSPPC